jgi:hypothetical protein
MKSTVAARPADPVRREETRAPDRAQLREAIYGRARDLSSNWRDAWREAWKDEDPGPGEQSRHHI